MRTEDFRDPSAGHLVHTVDGDWAFVPAPLPPKLAYDDELVMALSRADAAVSELAGVGRRLPNPHLLINPYIRREAVYSSRIEGTQTVLAELLLDEVTPAYGTRRDGGTRRETDLREVRNYVGALEYGVRRLPELPLSLRLVRELHERLMSGVRGEQAAPGEFRRVQNWIGPRGSTAATALYVPPPVPEMLAALQDWEVFLHTRGKIPDLIQCAIMHEQFEAIHPFGDGNGRLGRLLITLFLIERGRLTQPLLYLSAYIEEHRQDYYDLLQRVRTHGDWTTWLRFFLTGVADIGEAAVRQAGELMDLRERLRHELRDRGRALALVDTLLVNPYTTVSRAAEILGVSNQTARQAVNVLQEAGILEEVTGRAWGRVYVAAPILKAIEPE